MIDPCNITDFNRSDFELEEFALFAVLVAGKKAKSTAVALEKLLTHIRGYVADKLGELADMASPFGLISFAGAFMDLPALMKNAGIGCHTQKSKALLELVARSFLIMDDALHLDIRTCEVEELESVCGIGPKTARFIILHSRPNAAVAALDTHILKFLSDSGVTNVPKATPAAGPTYRRLEREFLHLVPANMTVADFDLYIWRKYSGN